MKILLINHKSIRCGVYQYMYSMYYMFLKGNRRGKEYIYCEVDNYRDLDAVYNSEMPDVMIFNYHDGATQWMINQHCLGYSAKRCVLVHDANKEHARSHNLFGLFHYYLGIDPDIEETNRTFGIIPMIREFEGLVVKEQSNEKKRVIGTFGFPFPHKNFNRIVKMVGDQYDNTLDVELNILMPKHSNNVQSSFVRGSIEGASSQAPHIKVNTDETFHENPEDVIRKLAFNDINIFMYDNPPAGKNVGVSGAVEFALSAKKPLMVNESVFFRHLESAFSEISMDRDNSIEDVIERGIRPLEGFYSRWSRHKYIQNFDRIMEII